MKNYIKKQLETIFPKTCLRIGNNVLDSIISDFSGIIKPGSFPEIIKELSKKYAIPDYVAELSLVELTYNKVQKSYADIKDYLKKPEVNPTIELVYTTFSVSMLFADDSLREVPDKEEWVLIWKDFSANVVRVKSASAAEIYAIKIVLEDIPLSEAALETNLTENDINDLLLEQSKSGLIIYP